MFFLVRLVFLVEMMVFIWGFLIYVCNCVVIKFLLLVMIFWFVSLCLVLSNWLISVFFDLLLFVVCVFEIVNMVICIGMNFLDLLMGMIVFYLGVGLGN